MTSEPSFAAPSPSERPHAGLNHGGRKTSPNYAQTFMLLPATIDLTTPPSKQMPATSIDLTTPPSKQLPATTDLTTPPSKQLPQRNTLTFVLSKPQSQHTGETFWRQPQQMSYGQPNAFETLPHPPPSPASQMQLPQMTSQEV